LDFLLLLTLLLMLSFDRKTLVTASGDKDDNRRRLSLVAGGMIRVLRQNAARANGISVDCAIVAAPASSISEAKLR
jgi:hypothetical protein